LGFDLSDPFLGSPELGRVSAGIQDSFVGFASPLLRSFDFVGLGGGASHALVGYEQAIEDAIVGLDSLSGEKLSTMASAASQVSSFFSGYEGNAGSPPMMMPGPAGALGVVARAGSLTNAEVRALYHGRLSEIQALDAELAQAGFGLRHRALTAFQARFDAKLQARSLMSDRALADSLPPPQPLSLLVRGAYRGGLRGDDVWRSILESSTRSNKLIDALLGGP
jgi:hypothetical protein